MNFFKKYFLVALLLPYSTHSFAGEDFFRWCGRYILSFRIVKWLNIIPQSDVTQLGKTLFDNKNSLKSVPSLDEKFLALLQKSSKNQAEAKEYQRVIPSIYSDQHLTLTGFCEILTQFENHQKQELLKTPWAEGVKKVETINKVHDEHNPTFFVQRVIIPENAKVYYLSDLHGGIQGILDVLDKIDNFNWNTLQLPANTYLCFTGDFVDKGLYGSLCLALSYQLKINNPTNVIITRGNHEDPDFLNIAKATEKDYLDFGTELYYRYYHSTGIIARLLQFLYPQEHLKNLIRQTYELLPVMAFILHRKSNDNGIEKKTPDSFVGFVASHAGLDTAYSPHRLLSIKEEKSIPHTLYDSYFDPQQKIVNIHPQNKEAQQAIENDLKISVKNDLEIYLDKLVLNTSNTQDQIFLNKITQLLGLIIRNDSTTTSLTISEKRERTNDINTKTQLNNYEKIIKEQVQALNDFQDTLIQFIKLPTEDKITFIKKVIAFKMCSLTITDNEIRFQKNAFGISFTNELLISLQKLVTRYNEFWSNSPQKITDLQCCWSWKTPDHQTPCFYKPATTSINFSISCAVHNALLKDWNNCNPRIHLHHSFQGHIQNGGLFYSTLPQHVDAYEHGCGCAWYPIEHTQDKDDSFLYTKTIPQNSAQVIAPGQDSCYGLGVPDKQYKTYKQDQLDKGLITKKSYFPQFKGQKFNPVVHTTFDSTTNNFKEYAYQAYPDGTLVYE